MADAGPACLAEWLCRLVLISYQGVIREASLRWDKLERRIRLRVLMELGALLMEQSDRKRLLSATAL